MDTYRKWNVRLGESLSVVLCVCVCVCAHVEVPMHTLVITCEGERVRQAELTILSRLGVPATWGCRGYLV